MCEERYERAIWFWRAILSEKLPVKEQKLRVLTRVGCSHNIINEGLVRRRCRLCCDREWVLG